MSETYEGLQVYIGEAEKVYCDNIAYNIHYSISYVIIPDRGINVINAYETKNDRHKEQFLDYVSGLAIGITLYKKRNKKSLMREWKAHNICYRNGWYKNRAKDTFLDVNEKWYRRVFYWFITLIFKEK